MVLTMSLIGSLMLAATMFISINVGHVCAQALSNDVNEADDSQSPQTSSSQADNPLRSILTRGSHRLNNMDLTGVAEAINSGNWDRFTPAPVTEPNCHVEIQVVQRVPGRCIRVGNGLPACQTSRALDLNNAECS